MTQTVSLSSTVSQDPPLVSLHDISKRYGSLPVLQNVNLAFHAGDFAAVTGASGSGKSTLLGILGLLERPTGGQYLLGGRDSWALGDAEQSRLRGETIGFIFQQFHLLPEVTALENVARPFRFGRVSRAEARERAAKALRRVGLEERLTHRPAQLSGGEQQRVAIARALVRRPALLLADEPTGNLPQAMWAEILDLFADLHASGHTVIVVTHDPLVAARAGRQVVLRDGRVEGQS